MNMGDIFLVHCLLVKHVASLPSKHIQIHDYCCFPNPSPQELNGAHFGPTNDMLLSFMYTSQESKKCNKFGNLYIPCSSNVIIK
jgi:hypothetical protein